MIIQSLAVRRMIVPVQPSRSSTIFAGEGHDTLHGPGRACYTKAMEIRTQNYISVNPEICHGKPCFKGTRIMVSLLLEMMEAGQTTQDILAGFPELDRRHLQAALHFAAQAVDSGLFTPTA